MLIAIGYPNKAMTNPKINIANGIYNASLILNASFIKSLFSSLIAKIIFAIINKRISTIMKSNPYNACRINEFGLFATKVVKYGIKETINIKKNV